MATIALRAAQRLPRALRVEWEVSGVAKSGTWYPDPWYPGSMAPFQDGLSAQFSYVWMRDNSDKRPSLLHLDMNSKPEVLFLGYGTEPGDYGSIIAIAN